MELYKLILQAQRQENNDVCYAAAYLFCCESKL
jgi:hypothetical protein